MIIERTSGKGAGSAPIAVEERAYFDAERAVAEDSSHPNHLLPSFPSGARVLDVGCGGSWDWRSRGIGSYIGVDIRETAIAYCLEHDRQGEFFVGDGENLEMVGDREVDQVMSKVAVPYMRLDAFAAEAFRVLSNGGGLWVSYHDARFVLKSLKTSWTQHNLRNVVYQSYVVVNGLLLHVLGRQFRFPLRARMESFQSQRSLKRALERAGFIEVQFWSSPTNSEQHVVTARKRDA